MIHLEEGLDIPAISAVYMEAHNTSHARTRLQGDTVINDVLDHALERESSYTRTILPTTEAENNFKASFDKVGGEIPTFSGGEAPQKKV